MGFSNDRVKNRKKRRRRRRRSRINYKPIILLVAVITIITAVILLLKSCGGHDVGKMDLHAGTGAIYIKDNGKVVYGVAEDFGATKLNAEEVAEELESQIETEVDQFNRVEASEEEAMKLDTFDVTENVAKAVFDFSTEQDFVSYMTLYNRANDFVKQEDDQKIYEFYMNNVTEYDGNREMVVVSQETKDKVSLAATKGTLLIVTGKNTIQVDGEITYVSENCKVSEDGIVETTDEGQSFIIFDL